MILRQLTLQDEPTFLRAIAAWDGDPGFMFARGYQSGMDFADYLKFLDNSAKGIDLAPDRVPDSILCLFVNDEIVGRVSIRHRLNDFLYKIGGHIGYGVLPSERRKGYAKAILSQSLPVAKKIGIEKVLVTCDDTNIGSIKTIEACGGRLENKVEAGEGRPLKRRYWITIP